MEPLSSVCRCCATEGPSKDIVTKYIWMGEEEVYTDMIQECFEITLQQDEDFNGICEVCITQLRNAFNFKKQVLHIEEQFKAKGAEFLVKSAIKVETLDTEVPTDSEDSNSEGAHSANEQEDTEYEVPIKEEKEETPPSRLRKRAAQTSNKAKSKRVKKETGEPSQSAAVAPRRRKKKRKEKESATPERLEHRVNLTAILHYSNASPFRDKTMHGFSCLYCAKHFKTIYELRDHTAQQSEKDKLNSMIDYKLSYNPIKVDITNLRCTVCDWALKDLSDLKEHLTSVHNKTIYKEIKDIILPFRLEDGTNFTCVICSVVHVSFKNLYQHMSSHYRNYCCDQCGVGYITIAALRKHHKTHEMGSFPCDFCEKVYTSMAKKRNHEKGVHTGGWLRNKCPQCPQIFVSYYDRSEHLVKVHNEKPLTYPCNACNKIYKKKFELNRHIKHHHLQQKSFICHICTAKFFSRRGMVDHMTRHTGGEIYSCDVCGKNFSRQRTLKDHLKTHEEDNRYQCEVCQKKFTQKCSLKSHMKLHQDHMDIFKEFDDVKHLIDKRDLTLKQIAEESKMKAAEEKAVKETEAAVFEVTLEVPIDVPTTDLGQAISQNMLL